MFLIVVGCAVALTRFFPLAFSGSPVAQLICDDQNRIVAVNEAFSSLTGYALHEVQGQNPNMLSARLTEPDVYVGMWAALQAKGQWEGEVLDRRKDGTTYTKYLDIRRVPHEGASWYLGSYLDQSGRDFAMRDSLTGLYTRGALETLLRQALMAATRNRQKVALMYLDLDGFKRVNDTYGHWAGDRLLQEVSARFQSELRETDCVARIGGDEFVIFLEPQDFTREGVSRVAKRLLQAAKMPVELEEGISMQVAASIGVAIYPDDAKTADDLLKAADTALYEAKGLGKDQYHYYSSSLSQKDRERRALEAAVLRNLKAPSEEHGFFLAYQPKYSLPERKIIGFEALIRMRDGARGVVGPGEFIPVIEGSPKLITELGNWVIMQVCMDLALLREKGVTPAPVSLNVSAHQLGPKLVERIQHACALYRIPAEWVVAEITEGAAMKNPELAVEVVTALRKMGVRVLIDDFGTGYSSLSYLSRLPVDGLKIDRSFVSGVTSDPAAAVITNATISLAHQLGLYVIAEGVETEAQAAYLAAQRCNAMQGFLMSRPVPLADAARMLAAR